MYPFFHLKMQKPYSTPQNVQYKCWSTTNEAPHMLKYPLCCPAKSRAKEDRNVGLRNKLCQLPSWTRRQMNQAEIGQQPKGEKTPPAVRQHATMTSCLSKTYTGNQPKGCPPSCSRQACPPHSPEEPYKRRVSTQYDSIQFCNGCSARDTCPPKLTELYSIKIHSVRPQSFNSSN